MLECTWSLLCWELVGLQLSAVFAKCEHRGKRWHCLTGAGSGTRGVSLSPRCQLSPLQQGLVTTRILLSSNCRDSLTAQGPDLERHQLFREG